MQTHHLAYSSIDEFDCSTWTCFNVSNIISKMWDEDLWDETLMIRRPCHQLLKAKNNRVVGG
jgi:hypothetical protein